MIPKKNYIEHRKRIFLWFNLKFMNHKRQTTKCLKSRQQNSIEFILIVTIHIERLCDLSDSCFFFVVCCPHIYPITYETTRKCFFFTSSSKNQATTTKKIKNIHHLN